MEPNKRPNGTKDIACCYADPALAKEMLGWEAQFGIKEMCDDTWNWQSNNPNGYKVDMESELDSKLDTVIQYALA